MSGSKTRTLELVYSDDRPVGVRESDKTGDADAGRNPAEEAQVIERFLTYLYEELRGLNKNQSAHLVGAAILALREDLGSGDPSAG